MIEMRTTITGLRAPARRSAIALLTRRALAERRRLLTLITVGGFLLAMLTTTLYSSLGAEYDALLDEMPAALAGMLGEADLGTLEGWLQAEIFSFMGPGLVMGAAIAVGSGALAGAEQQGRLVLVLSSPIRRSWIVLATAFAVGSAAAIASAGLFIGILVGASTAGISVSVGNVIAASLMLFLLGLTAGSLALLAGAFTGKRGAATATALTVTIASYCSYSFFPLSDHLESFASVSLWHPFASSQPLRNGVPIAHAGIFIGLAAMLVAAAVAGFERRDVHG